MSPANKSLEADCRKPLVLISESLAAGDPSRYAAFSYWQGGLSTFFPDVQHQMRLAKFSRKMSLDNSTLYVYTCNVSNNSLKAKLAIANQVPATCMGFHVRRASRILTQAYAAALRPTKLVHTQFTLLVAIHLFESVAITQLADELFTDQTTITRNIKLLEKRGLVASNLGEDRRIKLVSLTVEGQIALEQALPLWEQAQAELMQHFGQQKWQTLLSLLSEVKTLSE